MAIIKKFRIKSFKKIKSIIEFENISLAYGNRLILDNISFKINEGQIFGMLGPNGVGKSTIFNLITGLINPKHGKIKINGEEVGIIEAKSRSASEVILNPIETKYGTLTAEWNTDYHVIDTDINFRFYLDGTYIGTVNYW